MATPEQLALLREYVNELDDAGGWTDAKLTTLLESVGDDVRKAAGQVWQAKAGQLTTLNDITESGSSRRLSQTFDHALKMAAHFGAAATEVPVPTTPTGPQFHRVVRATRE